MLFFNSTKEIIANLYVLINAIQINQQKASLYLFVYYLLLITNTIIESVGLILLTNLVTNNMDNFLSSNEIFLSVYSYLNLGHINHIYLITYVLFFGLSSRIILLIFYKYLIAKVRYKIQTKSFFSIISSEWIYAQEFKVGEAVNIISQEAARSSKLISSLIDILSYLIIFIVIMIMMLNIDSQAAVTLFIISLVPVLLIAITYFFYSRLAKKGVNLRNLFSSEITDRLNGLLQINIDNNFKYHHTNAKNIQSSITRNDIVAGVCQAFIGSSTQFISLSLFLVLSFLLLVYNFSMPSFDIYALLIILAIRGFSQLGLLMSSIAGLIEISASITHVNKLLKLPGRVNRKIIKDQVDEIYITNLDFSYKNSKIFNNFNCHIKKGSLYRLSGKSGSGKSTLANLISGIIKPNNGNIEYLTKNKKFDSRKFYPKIAYVSQDIYLFNGTIRDNLQVPDGVSDELIYNALALVDATNFILQLGGLDANVDENGKFFSGGQKRRLGIARGIIKDVDIFIFDEINAGLDTDSNLFINKLISDLSKNFITIVINHEKTRFKNSKVIMLNGF